MTSGRFNKLEEINLLLDILIDCEEYAAVDSTIKEMEGIKRKITIKDIENPTKEHLDERMKEMQEKSNNGAKTQLSDDVILKLTEEKIEAKIDGIRNKTQCGNNLCADDYFEIIFESKYLRRFLLHNKMNIPRSRIDFLLQGLAEALIKTIPTNLTTVTDDEKERPKLRIIFLNEISAVSQGYLTIGYAEMALSELKELNENWQKKKGGQEEIRHPYELYALYNKGLKLGHDHTTSDTEKAIDTFSQIIKSFEKKDTKWLRHTFENDYPQEKHLFPIFFWLIYIPTIHLLADAYDALDSSYDVEKTIFNVLERMRCEKVILQNGNISTEIVEKHNEAKFAIQLLFSRIYSGVFDKNLESNNPKGEGTWLTTFKGFFPNFKWCVDPGSLKKYAKSGEQIDAAEALFWLEYAKAFRKEEVEKNEYILRCFDKCSGNLIRENISDTDWSDFAVTLLDGIIFILDEHTNKDIDWTKNLIDKNSSDGKHRIEEFNKIYSTIFNKITSAEWIPRKRELVDKFLNYQEKILQKYGHFKRDNCNTCVKNQITLVKTILNDEKNRIFKKKWPEWEKAKLVRSLKNTIDLIRDDDLKDAFKKSIEIIYYDKNIFPEEENLGDVIEFIKNDVNCDYYTKKLRLNTETFYDHLIYKSCRPSLEEGYKLTVLRRWQSFTPALSVGSEIGQKGGGYFVYKTNGKGEIDEGLVIDPGFNFLANFFDEGFNIRDINAILMTHSHPDHSSDFMSIITLVHEMNKRGKRVFSKWEDRKPILFMTDGCYHKFAEQIGRKRDAFCDIIRVKKDDDYPRPGRESPFLKHFNLEITKANHNDQTDYDSVGYIIKDKSNPPRDLIGFTGDTQWFNGIEDKYINCPVLCMNIGGVVDIFKENVLLSDLVEDNKDNKFARTKNILIKENHLYLPGFYLMAQRLGKKTKLIILSELCEEMKGGLRTDLAERISKNLDVAVLPEDIGLTVLLDKEKKNIKVLCKICQDFCSPNDIAAIETDRDNAIVYLCNCHYNKLKEGYSLPKINELELDVNELRNPLIKKDSASLSSCLKKITGK